LKKGLKFIVGTWEVDFLVNPMSANLDHMPASNFKTTKGDDMSKITWEFFEDHTMKLRNGATGEEESGTWEQTTASGKYKYKCEKFFGLLPPELVETISTVEKDLEGGLVFTMFVVVRLKKTAEGNVTGGDDAEEKKEDIGSIQPSAEEQKMKAIVGRWKVYKTMACINDDFGMFTVAEIRANSEKKKAAGEMSQEHYEMSLLPLGIVVEFTDDHKVNVLSPLPPGVTPEDVESEVASGEIKLVDGMVVDPDAQSEWKFVKGEYWYDSKEKVEIFGEVQSPWAKITPDSEGHMEFRTFVMERQ